MKLFRFLAVALLAIALPASLLLPSCGHMPPNPGQVVVSCTMDAVKDPAVIQRVLTALDSPDWAARIAGIVATVPGVTSEAVACILRSFLGQLSANPAKAQQYSRARLYLHDHGYEAP